MNNMRGDLVLEDISTGEKFLLESSGTSYYCGRGRSSQIISRSVLVSREHCVFIRSSRGLNVIDWGSANGIYINGQQQQAKMMIELRINDLIGLGCPDVQSCLPPERAAADEGTRFQTKTIYRLKLPETEPEPNENDVPADAEPMPEETREQMPEQTPIDAGASSSADIKRRLSKDSSYCRLPCKKLKIEEAASIPDVIDIADSDDEMPFVPNEKNKPSTSSNPFRAANLCVIKYEPLGEGYTSHERDLSVGLVDDNEMSVAAGKSTCDSNINGNKSQDGDKSHCHHTSKNAKPDKRSDAAIKKLGSSGDTNWRREDGRKEKTKSFRIRVNHLGQFTRVVSEEPDSRIKLPNTATSSVESSRCNEQVVPTRCPSENFSSDKEIDILRREELLDLPEDESSHSSWRNVKDFSVPGYNTEEIELHDETELHDQINTDVATSNDVAVHQEIKYEPELHIMDTDESIYTDVSNLSQSLTPTSIKVKRVVKQEPITQYSQFDVVALSDDEDDVFPASQLFGDDEDIETESKVKIENELSNENEENENEENENEIFDRRENDYPDQILVPDSDDEDNPWYDRLMRAELNVSRESVIKKVREGTKIEEDALMVTDNEIAPISAPEETSPMSPPEETSPMSPPEEGAPMSTIEEDAPELPTENDARESPIEENAPEYPMDDFVKEMYDICSATDKNKTETTVIDNNKHEKKKKRTKNLNKTEKPAEEHVIRKVPHEHRSGKDDSTSVKEKSADSKVYHKKRSHHHVKQKSVDRAADPEDAEVKTSSQKSKSHKHDGEKRRNSGEAKGASIADSSNNKRDSTEGKSSLRTETPVHSIPNRLPVVVLTKLDHVRKSVPLVEAPFIGNGQRRGVSCNIKRIDRSTNKPDIHAASTSRVQPRETNVDEIPSRKEPKLSAKEKKESYYNSKIEEKKYMKDQKQRRQINKWAECLPVGKKQSSASMSRQERDEIRHDRKEKLKKIADKEKEQVETNELPARRVTVKAKAKVTERSRNDFLVNELEDQYANIKRTSVDNRDKVSDLKKGKDKPLDLRKETTANNEIPVVHEAALYKENNEEDNEVLSSRLERGSTANGEAPLVDREKSPKGKKRKSKSLDSGKENAENGGMIIDEGANSITNLSSTVRSCLILEQRREAPIDNRHVDKSKMQTSVPRAAALSNGTAKVVEESQFVAGQTLNNNVMYEKESTIALRDPRIKTGKPVKLKSLLKTNSRLKASTPRVIKRVSFDDLNTKVQYFEINPGNSLRTCNFKDAPSTIKNLPKHNDTVGTTGPKLEEFLLRIFEWNPVWLQEQKLIRTPPPVVNEKELVPMVAKYETYEAYYEVAAPLLALELWHGISKDYDNGEVIQKSSMKFSIVNYSVTRTIVPSTDLHVTTLMIEVVVNKKQLQVQAHPVFGDLIFFEYVSNIKVKGGGFQRWKVFAYVTKLHQAVLTPFTQFNRDLLNYVQDAHMLLTYTVMTKPLNPCEMQTNKISRLGTISYLRSNIRMIQALQYLPNSPLLNIILHPKIEDYQLPPATNLESYPLATKDNLNSKQLEAVVRVTEVVEQKLPKICLIQGPPGTGKSKVIVNLITQILYGRGKNCSKKPMRILVCAPSNAAVDEIVLRLLEIRRTFQKGNRFNMVRVGRDQAMHPMVKEVSLTELAKKNVKNMTDIYMSPDFSAESIAEEKHFLEARKNSLELELATGRSLGLMHMKYITRKLRDIRAKYDLLTNRQSAENLDPKESSKLQRASENTLLKGADVIACTLTSCYTTTMESIFLGSDASISVCIVDEATQSVEAETLVPLMLGVQTLVLVGDTNQLPAIVLSQKAKQLGLDQSLFGRIQNSFDGQVNNPIILLDTQYRMSYPVAFWPNRYFYAGALKNSANLRNLPFNFYKVINLDSTQDIDKFTNTNEANFVANLVYTIMARSNLDNTYPQVKIGIITPYNNQKTIVTKKIKERIALLPDKMKKKFVYEVNTVDSFQGQERDLIIMSCVRSNGIGFLSDRQRLCVALTRAKHSLILCGNFTAFQRHPMWNALLSDARARGVYLNMRSSSEVEQITKHIVR